MGSCERKPAGRLVSSRPLWSHSGISVQAWKNPPSEDGQVQDPIRISFSSVDGASWFLPWGKLVVLVNEGNVTVGRNLAANRFGGNEFSVRYRQCHRLSAEPLTFCSGHDHEVVFGQVQVAEIIEQVDEARDEWDRLFGGEYGGLPLPRLASQVLITEALRARGALGSSFSEDEDLTARRDSLFEACGGPDEDPKPLDIEPSLGKKEPYDDDESGDGGVGTGNPPTGGERGTHNPSGGSTDSADESAARLRQRLIDRGLIKPLVEEPRAARQDSPDDVS